MISEFRASKNIKWRSFLEQSSHFGGFWDDLERSKNTHSKCIISEVKLTFREMSTVLGQIEAYLSSHSLIHLNHMNRDFELFAEMSDP